MTAQVSAATARATFDGTAEHFDAPSIGFWERYGERTVTRLGLRPGDRVLDVAAGSGSSALAAARVVGSTGSVLAVDLSPVLLELAHQKAAREQLGNLTTRVVDMVDIDVDLEAGSFDAVVIVFGIFFVPDMTRQVAKLARLVRPGGQLAITVWGSDLFAPLYNPFLESVRALCPALDEYRPWDRVTTPDDVANLMRDAGLAEFSIEREPGREPIREPADWWTIVLGTGLRWFLDQLPASSLDAFREANLNRAREVTSIQTNVIYASARIQGDNQ